jgi:hypothetical protein
MNFTSGVLLMLYESLPNCDWTRVYNRSWTDLAVDSIDVVVMKL